MFQGIVPLFAEALFKDIDAKKSSGECNILKLQIDFDMIRNNLRDDIQHAGDLQ